jgi:hypothetical protein
MEKKSARMPLTPERTGVAWLPDHCIDPRLTGNPSHRRQLAAPLRVRGLAMRCRLYSFAGEA